MNDSKSEREIFFDHCGRWHIKCSKSPPESQRNFRSVQMQLKNIRHSSNGIFISGVQPVWKSTVQDTRTVLPARCVRGSLW